MKTEKKTILDACCGSRMFWFDRSDPRAIYVDNRRETHVLKDSSSKHGTRELVVNPDVLANFTQLPFDDGVFDLVLMDPPHLIRSGPKSWQTRKYGKLCAGWEEQLRAGFVECFRVLRHRGTLIFKWNETHIPVSAVLALTHERPVIGNRCGKSAKTHWLVFLKP